MHTRFVTPVAIAAYCWVGGLGGCSQQAPGEGVAIAAQPGVPDPGDHNHSMPSPPTSVLKRGDRGEEVESLHAYLEHFGYLDEAERQGLTGAHVDAATNVPGGQVFDQRLGEALRLMQRFYHLPDSGELDAPTLAAMQRPRCGAPDFARETPNSPVAEFRLGSTRLPRWHRSLTYNFSNQSNDLDVQVQRNVVRAAMNKWADVTALTFREDSGRPEVRVGWYGGDHGDGFPFAANVLAHAFYPNPGMADANALFSDLHFNDALTWLVTDGGSIAPAGNLESVAVHEMGHSLGLDHSDNPQAVMYPFDYGQETLQDDDIQGVRSMNLGLPAERGAPYGSLLRADATGGVGWAYDPDAEQGSVEVRIMVDGNAYATVRADQDIAEAAPPAGQTPVLQRSFRFTLGRLTGGTHTIAAVAVNQGPGGDVSLTGSGKTFQTPDTAPLGTLEQVTPDNGSGWAYDFDLGGAASTVQVFVDGTLWKELAADRPRQDLVDQNVAPEPNHGFQFVMPPLAAGTHTVAVKVPNPAAPNGQQDLAGSPFTLQLEVASNPPIEEITADHSADSTVKSSGVSTDRPAAPAASTINGGCAASSATPPFAQGMWALLALLVTLRWRQRKIG